MITEELEQFHNVLKEDDRIASIFDSYQNIIAPFIFQLEILDGEYPIEILNEIRAIFTHLARSANSDSIDVYEDNIIKAERHIKRATLDCFKYLCVSYDDHYKEFEKMYNGIDLSFVDNGQFLPELCKKRKNSIELLQTAKKKELNTSTVEDVFHDYELAYNAYSEVYTMINSSYEKFENLKIRAIKKARYRSILDVCGIIGTLFGIIGVVLTIFK